MLKFIRSAMEPKRHMRNRERCEPLRALLNGALAFRGQAVDPSGALVSADVARTVPEAQKRAADFRADLVRRVAVSGAVSFERTLDMARLFRLLHSWVGSDCMPPL